MSENLIEAIQGECARVRKIIPYYTEIGPVGSFGKMMLEKAVRDGEAAIAHHDVVAMVAALEALRDCSA